MTKFGVNQSAPTFELIVVDAGLELLETGEQVVYTGVMEVLRFVNDIGTDWEAEFGVTVTGTERLLGAPGSRETGAGLVALATEQSPGKYAFTERDAFWAMELRLIEWYPPA